MVSCNDALMQIADAEGKDIFLRYQNSFGFGAKTGIDLPGEEVGILHTVDNTGATELATSSFGQTFTTTMIQMAAAFSSLVNGGYYYQPHVVKQIVNDNGATVKDFNELLVRETVSKETSDFIQEALYQTVEQGTAGGAKVEGYSVGGKTGTAQKLPRDAKTYVVSFLGCAPAINPEIVIYVVIDEPQNVEKQADSSIATKFASKILKEILPALGIYPEGDIDYLLSDDQITGTPADGTSPATTDNTNGTPDGQADTQTQDTQTQDTQTQDTQTQDTQTQDTQTEDTQTEDTQTEDTQTEDTTGLDNAVGQNPESTVDPSGTEDNNAEDGTPADNAGDDEYNPDALD
jgi:stage V sporulation protein D (sporulation-specific penicillin-binding protein)